MSDESYKDSEQNIVASPSEESSVLIVNSDVYSKESDSARFEGLHKILKDCKLEHLTDIFEKEDIDDECLMDLNDSNISDWQAVTKLLPTIGAKSKFKKALRKLHVRKFSMYYHC